MTEEATQRKSGSGKKRGRQRKPPVEMVCEYCKGGDLAKLNGDIWCNDCNMIVNTVPLQE